MLMTGGGRQMRSRKLARAVVSLLGMLTVLAAGATQPAH